MKNNLLPLALAFLSTASLALGLVLTIDKIKAHQHSVVHVNSELLPYSR